MNILYCGDRNIKDGLTISVLSLLRNSPGKLAVYVMTAEFEFNGRKFEKLSAADIEPIKEKLEAAGADNSLTLIDVTAEFSRQLPHANMDTRFTPCCMLRLYADCVSSLPERLLYLDNDVICRAPFNDFYNQDIDGVEVVGVLDHYGSWFFRKNLFRRDYVNSGVLLLNMRKIRETGLFTACRYRCMHKKMFMPDQSAINDLARAKRLAPRKYNEQRRLRKDTVLQHFTTSFRFFPWIRTVTVKPWELERMHSVLKIHEYDDILNEYMQTSRTA